MIEPGMRRLLRLPVIFAFFLVSLQASGKFKNRSRKWTWASGPPKISLEKKRDYHHGFSIFFAQETRFHENITMLKELYLELGGTGVKINPRAPVQPCLPVSGNQSS